MRRRFLVLILALALMATPGCITAGLWQNDAVSESASEGPKRALVIVAKVLATPITFTMDVVFSPVELYVYLLFKDGPPI